MGNGIVKFVLTRLKRPIRDFNLESRAHKEISKDKPSSAPRHKTDVQFDYMKILQDYPSKASAAASVHHQEDEQEIINKKHEQLDENLKNVYVKSHDSTILQSNNHNNTAQRSLPLDRSQVEDFEYGVKIPDRVPVGRASLKQILQFISDYQRDPKTHTVQKISQDYFIAEEKVENILQYFKPYELYIPKDRKVKATFMGPSVPKVKLIHHPTQLMPEQISSSNNNNKKKKEE